MKGKKEILYAKIIGGVALLILSSVGIFAGYLDYSDGEYAGWLWASLSFNIFLGIFGLVRILKNGYLLRDISR